MASPKKRALWWNALPGPLRMYSINNKGKNKRKTKMHGKNARCPLCHSQRVQYYLLVDKIGQIHYACYRCVRDSEIPALVAQEEIDAHLRRREHNIRRNIQRNV